MNTNIEIFNFIESIGINPLSLEIEKPVDISKSKKQILSFNFDTSNVVWSDISKVVRKEDEYEFVVSIGEKCFSVSPVHLFYAKIEENEPAWIEASSLQDEKFYLFDGSEWKEGFIFMSGKKIKIFDLEVPETHCYFSNGFLSHNTMYGDPMITPGGKGVPYHSSVRIRLESGVQLKNETTTKDVFGIHTRAKIVKSRLGPPWRKTEFDILFASGVDDETSWFHELHKRGEIVKKGGWCYMPSIPSGELETDGVDKGKDLGISFRESAWHETLDGAAVLRPDQANPSKLVPFKFDVRSHVLDLLEKHMIVKFGEKPSDLDLNPDSLMDSEAVLEHVQTGA